MDAEIDGLTAPKRRCWRAVDRSTVPAHETILRPIWVFKNKLVRGKVVRHKARLVVDGSAFNTETYVPDGQWHSSPVADRSTVRSVLCIAALRCLKLGDADLSQAYTAQRMPFSKPVYMYLPEGYGQTGADGKPRVALLERPLYGLPFSGKALYCSLSDWLQRIGFSQSLTDPCLFIYRKGGDEMVAGVTVDDILFAGSSDNINAAFITALKRKFEITHNDNVTHHLGFDIIDRVHGDTRTIEIDISQQIDDLVHECGLDDAPGAANPHGSDAKYAEWYACDDAEAQTYLNAGYRRRSGSISYIAAVSRPDVQQSASVLARYNRRPGRRADDASKRTVRYLKSTRRKHLCYSGHRTVPVPWDNICVETYVDADHASCPDSRKSYTGLLHFIRARHEHGNDSPVGAMAWRCARQGCITSNSLNDGVSNSLDDGVSTAKHSTDAEVIALTDAVAPVRRLRNLLREIGAPQLAPSRVHSDSQPAINTSQLATTPGMAHWNIRMASLRELLRKRICTLQHIAGGRNPADALTKRLPTPKFVEHAGRMLGRSE